MHGALRPGVPAVVRHDAEFAALDERPHDEPADPDDFVHLDCTHDNLTDDNLTDDNLTHHNTTGNNSTEHHIAHDPCATAARTVNDVAPGAAAAARRSR